MDYRGLNAVTKLDSFPLPRIEDLLDVLGKAKYFSSIDLTSGFWQIKMHPNSREKTAFVPPQGLYEFRVMPFGLTNAPAVFQRLMQQMISSLNPGPESEFLSVYIDGILVFSETLDQHLLHLERVIQRIMEVGLKLKPAKCRFIQGELEYLGHLVSQDGLKLNPRLVEAAEQFAMPTSVQETRWFLGLCSYNRKFIPPFAAVASPLHQLTHQDTVFQWSPAGQQAYEELKQRLISAPILAYPNFDADFILETDASVCGLGAVLSQLQADDRPHPVSYASRALNGAEKKYGITELETLAVVWGMSHFHHFLYGHNVTFYTDHTAVKAVLEAKNPTAKHARWWTKVYARGVKNIEVRYQARRENANVDALSLSPHLLAPTIGVTEDEVQGSTLSDDNDGWQPMMGATSEGELAPCMPDQPGKGDSSYAQQPLGVAHVGMDSNQHGLVIIGQESGEAAMLGELPFYPMLEDNQTSQTNKVIGSSASGIMSDLMESTNLPAKSEAKGTTIATIGATLPVLDAPMLHSTLRNICVTQTDGATVVMLNYVLETDPKGVHSTDSGNQRESILLAGCLDNPTAPHSGSQENQGEPCTVTNGLETQTVSCRPVPGEQRRSCALNSSSENQVLPHSVHVEHREEYCVLNGHLESQTTLHSADLENQTNSHTLTDSLENRTVFHAADPVNQKESDALVDGQTVPWEVDSRKQRESHTPAKNLEN